jgi:hypothetical protein
MPLPEHCVQEFRSLWKEAHGEELDYQIAEQYAAAVLWVMKSAFLPSGDRPP